MINIFAKVGADITAANSHRGGKGGRWEKTSEVLGSRGEKASRGWEGSVGRLAPPRLRMGAGRHCGTEENVNLKFTVTRPGFRSQPCFYWPVILGKSLLQSLRYLKKSEFLILKESVL